MVGVGVRDGVAVAVGVDEGIGEGVTDGVCVGVEDGVGTNGVSVTATTATAVGETIVCSSDSQASKNRIRQIKIIVQRGNMDWS